MIGALTHLEDQECWQLLAEHRLGRMAIVQRGNPVVVPVNYVVSDSSVVCRVGRGSLLDPGEEARPVAVEIDGARPEYHAGWSVVLQGRATQVRDPGQLAVCSRLPLRPWVTHDESICVRVTGEVTGRRVGFP
jgi:nitroimidazol reductase NimA-like FMN-containing flavoprotein (pyridoxamine 5'-phosphate oxidase superfamily)